MKKILCLPLLFAAFISDNSFAQERARTTTVQRSMDPNTILVLSAVVKDKVIEDAEVIFQHIGKQSISVRTDARGMAKVPQQFADDNESLIIIKKDGYSNLVSKCACRGLTYALSPNLKDLDGVRVVLSWGRTPMDLDLHVRYGDKHVYYSNMKEQNANLDVDDTDSYGPETITINKKEFGKRYRFFIHDYTNRENPESLEMSRSGAQIYVYVGSSLIKTIDIPEHTKGNAWHIFDLTENGELVASDAIFRTYDASSEIGSQTYSTLETLSRNNPGEALRLNELGETAYHEGNYTKAIILYRQAIDNNGSLGQAYSNLGLAYYKNGNMAEALWANRKAVSLASGTDAKVIKASSYFNIAKIYENAGDYGEAFRHYKLAKENNNLPAYDNAIKRVKPKITSR